VSKTIRQLETFKSLQGQAMPAPSPQTVSGYLIGQAAKMSAASGANIRFYEKTLVSRRGMGAGCYRLMSLWEISQILRSNRIELT
jgi:hypothetical protein